MVVRQIMCRRPRMLVDAALALAACLLWSVACAQDNLSVTIDRTKIYSDETAKLVVTAAGPSLLGYSPQLEALELDFEITGQSSQTNMRVENGRTEVHQQWTIEIRPRRTGTLQIPPIGLGGLQTDPLMIEVAQYQPNIPSTDADVFLDLQVIPEKPYVQSQVTLVLRLYYAIEILRGAVVEPRITFGEIEELGSPRRYAAEQSGKRYTVTEIRYVIFPEQSGEFEIPSIDFNGIVSQASNHSLQGINSHLRISSAPQRIVVRPKPASFSGTTWLPASDIQIIDSWGDALPDFESGRPEQRRVTVVAQGLRSAQLPAISYQAHDSVRIYSSNPEFKDRVLDGAVVSERGEDFAIIPSGSGVVNVPAFKIVWWDVDEDREKIAMLPAISGAGAAAETVLGDLQRRGDAAERALPWLGADASAPRFGWLIAAGAVLAWLITALSWYFHARRARKSGTAAAGAQFDVQTEASLRRLRRQLKNACQRNDAAAAGQALLAWSAQRWPQPPGNLFELGNRIGDARLAAELRRIDQLKYCDPAQRGAWEGRVFWALFDKAVASPHTSSPRRSRLAKFAKSRPQLAELWPVSKSSR